jgi:hypothetical protein
VGDFNFQFIQEFAHLRPGEAQLFRQLEGRGAGKLARRGRRLDFRFEVDGFGHSDGPVMSLCRRRRAGENALAAVRPARKPIYF